MERKDEIHRIVEKNKGSQVKVFGSIVSGNMTENSDTDILVKFHEDASLFDLVEIKLELEDLFKKKVDALKHFNCDMNQGYCFSKPLFSSAFIEFLY